MMYITFEDLSEDKLSRVRWQFYLKDKDFILDEYVEEHRESMRKRNFEIDRIYSRLTNTTRLYQKNKCMSKEDVLVTDEIKQRTINEFLSIVEFK